MAGSRRGDAVAAESVAIPSNRVNVSYLDVPQLVEKVYSLGVAIPSNRVNVSYKDGDVYEVWVEDIEEVAIPSNRVNVSYKLRS